MNDTASIESKMDAYIAEHNLGLGSALPTPAELALNFGCTEGEVLSALDRATQRNRLSVEGGHWIVASGVLSDDHGFSFTASAKAKMEELVTNVIDVSVRLPIDDPDDAGFYDHEREAQKALKLEPNQPFITIFRVRLLRKRPSVIHRAYLNPAHFPPNFEKLHDFSAESLISTYRQHGHELITRDTVLKARITTLHEIQILSPTYGSPYNTEPRANVVLDAEQLLWAKRPGSEDRYVVEFLKASYVEHWKYTIKNRPAA
jgi:DNA-binding GntR family transcriptional regulator